MINLLQISLERRTEYVFLYFFSLTLSNAFFINNQNTKIDELRDIVAQLTEVVKNGKYKEYFLIVKPLEDINDIFEISFSFEIK